MENNMQVFVNKGYIKIIRGDEYKLNVNKHSKL